MRHAIEIGSGALATALVSGDVAAIGCAATALAGAVGLGVAFPSLGVFGPVESRIAGEPGTIALTFDDGPDPRFTPRVLEALARAGHLATFFLVGRSLERHADQARAIRDAGHSLGVHSFAHSSYNAFFGKPRLRADFEAAERVWETALGGRPALYRPPVGLVNPNVMAVARERGYRVVAWSLRALDGVLLYEPGAIRARVRRVTEGDIVLMHDALLGDSDAVPPGVLALPGILDDLAARGLRSVALG
ncbi:MAG: polysaccharide deacetylase family protein [Deltaproteobacteria bacterium]|nr:polysaccharide deacetylase family protein [Deltaproteobacteria bacterium]